METYMLTSLQKSILAHLESIETSDPKTIKISRRVSEGDFVVFTKNCVDKATLETLNNTPKNSILPIQSVKIKKNHILVSLNRSETFAKCIQLINSLSSDYGRSLLFSKEKINFFCEKKSSVDDLTDFRVNFLVKIAGNLASAVGFTVSENECSQRLYFTHKSNGSIDITHCKLLLCGVVKNAETKAKEINTTVSDYKRIKNSALVEEMKDRDKILEHVTILLTEALLKFNLLHVKVNSPVVMNFNPILKDFDGAAIFIMYNYSRLNTIIHEYENRVQKKFYPPLPPVDLVDFSVLKEEKEWILLFNFLLQFPNVVLYAVKNIKEGQFSPYLLYNFLCNMSRTVSSYYRSTKVLLYNQPQLFPLIVARMYLIKAVHQVFTNGLHLLDIKPAPAL